MCWGSGYPGGLHGELASGDEEGEEEEEEDDSSGQLLALFVQGQACEESGDVTSAHEAYTRLVRAAESTVTPEAACVTDEALHVATSPPTALLVALALTSLAHARLDTSPPQQREARVAFTRSLVWWPGNASAIIKLGDLAHASGEVDEALRYFQQAADLPPWTTKCATQSSEGGEGEGREGGEGGEGGEGEGGADGSTDADGADGADDDSADGADDDSADGADGADDDVTPAWTLAWVVGPRTEALSVASYMCALLHHQALRPEAALPYIRRFHRVRYRLAPAVWKLAARAPLPEGSNRSAKRPREAAIPSRSDAHAVRRFDDAVPASLLAVLLRGFGPTAPFWAETCYATRGASSFWYDVSRPPSNVIEAWASQLLAQTGVASRVVGCEWWVHTRTGGCSVGHPLHFDTEETCLMRGELLHPLVSTVTYLECPPARADPTLILNQRAGDEGGSWVSVSHPNCGTVLLFPGDLLHGVCPQPPPHATTDNGTTTKGGPSAKARDAAASSPAQRLTLMINFWHRPVHLACRRAPLDACGPMPRPSRSCTWPDTLAMPHPESPVTPSWGGVLRPVPRLDASPWEQLQGGPAEGEDAVADAWAGRLELPAARDCRFFVARLNGFLSDHLAT